MDEAHHTPIMGRSPLGTCDTNVPMVVLFLVYAPEHDHTTPHTLFLRWENFVSPPLTTRATLHQGRH
jgi:hypothetical protein